MSILRSVRQVLKYFPLASETGIRLKRAFGFYQAPGFDPFLLLDEIHPGKQSDVIPVIPWHPHRGVETINYLIKGQCAQSDRKRPSGTLTEGCVYRLSSGAGAVHQEFELAPDTEIRAFQLWINMPAARKMSKPVSEFFSPQDIPSAGVENGVQIRIIAGTCQQLKGPLVSGDTELDLFDIAVPPNTKFKHKVSAGKNVFAYIYSGAAEFFEGDDETLVASGHTILFGNGNSILLESGGSGVHLLLAAGIPIKEELAWSGPIVMNNDLELRQAFREYEEGNFLKR
ncbi:MAG: pirin family protein [Spirochaetales bacterium]|nr:pirin family protein [Spirochaetales bacterium]